MNNVVAANNAQPTQDAGAYIKSESGQTSLTPQPAKEMPLEIYSREKSQRYINELLGVDNMLPENVNASVDVVDNYINAELKKRGYDPTTKAYRETLEEFKSDLGIDDNTNLEISLERMSKYIEAEGILKSLKSLDESKVLKELRKSPTSDLMDLVMKQIEKQGL